MIQTLLWTCSTNSSLPFCLQIKQEPQKESSNKPQDLFLSLFLT